MKKANEGNEERKKNRTTWQDEKSRHNEGVVNYFAIFIILITLKITEKLKKKKKVTILCYAMPHQVECSKFVDNGNIGRHYQEQPYQKVIREARGSYRDMLTSSSYSAHNEIYHLDRTKTMLCHNTV